MSRNRINLLLLLSLLTLVFLLWLAMWPSRASGQDIANRAVTVRIHSASNLPVYGLAILSVDNGFLRQSWVDHITGPRFTVWVGEGDIDLRYIPDDGRWRCAVSATANRPYQEGGVTVGEDIDIDVTCVREPAPGFCHSGLCVQ